MEGLRSSRGVGRREGEDVMGAGRNDTNKVGGEAVKKDEARQVEVHRPPGPSLVLEGRGLS
jgi:hypothetical protein